MKAVGNENTNSLLESQLTDTSSKIDSSTDTWVLHHFHNSQIITRTKLPFHYSRHRCTPRTMAAGLGVWSQNCSVLHCVLKLCTVISTLRWAVLTVLWIGFCLTGPFHCVYIFIYVYLCAFFSHCIMRVILLWAQWGALTLLVGSFDPKKPTHIWPIMCLVGC